jgi:Na+/phosphate symporter
MNIRHTGTGEVFYVDNVSNYASFTEDNVERATTLQVSRGMVEKDLDKYFSLVKRKTNVDKINWQVNQEVFKYLLERRQFR